MTRIMEQTGPLPVRLQPLARLTFATEDARLSVDLAARPHRVIIETRAMAQTRRLRASGEIADRLVSLIGSGVPDITVLGAAMPGDAFEINAIETLPRLEPRKRVLIFGDSNTWGWASTGLDQPCERLPDGTRWTCVAGRLLGGECEIVVDGLVNRTTDLDMARGWGAVPGHGFNGSRSLEVAIARNMPLDLVVIALGTNDLQNQFGRDAHAIADGLTRLVAMVEASAGGVNTCYPAPRAMIVAPPRINAVPAPRMGRAFAGATARSQGLGRAIAEALPDLPLVDLQDLLGAARGQDGIHLTPTEHYVLGVNAAERIRDLIAPGRLSQSLQAEISLHETNPGDVSELAAHLLRLSPKSRELRFGHGISDSALEKIVQSASRGSLSLMRHRDEVCGAVELHPIDAHRAEIGLSVEDPLQGRGLGRRLFAAGIAAAHGMGVEQLLVICLEENSAMRRLVEIAGGDVAFNDGEVTCWLDVPEAMRALADHCAELACVISSAATGRQDVPTAKAHSSPTEPEELRAPNLTLSPLMRPYLDMQRRTLTLQRQALDLQRRSVLAGFATISLPRGTDGDLDAS